MRGQVRCGRENFAKGREIVKALVAIDPTRFVGWEDFMLELLEKYEAHCKIGLPKHIKRTSKVANHCAHHMFGGQQHHSSSCGDVCAGHKEHCKDCDRGVVFVHVLRFVSSNELHDHLCPCPYSSYDRSKMMKTLGDANKLTGQDIEDIEFRVDQFESRMHKYIAHLVRGAWEINNKSRFLVHSETPLPLCVLTFPLPEHTLFPFF